MNILLFNPPQQNGSGLDCTMQLPQHYTCKTKHHFLHTIVPNPQTKTALRKLLQFILKRNCSNHEFHLDTKTSRLFIANWLQNILTTKHIKNKPSANGLVANN